MTEEIIEYKQEEIINYLKPNYLVMTLLPIIYLNKKNQSVKEYATFVGELLAVTWEQFTGAPKKEIAKLIGMNYAAAGAKEVKFIENEDGFTVKIVNWPNPGFMQAMGTNKKIVSDFHYVWEPIVKFLGLTFELQSTETEDLLIFKKG